MSQNLVTNSKRIHFIGIGGIGMSALAKICHFSRISVTGSDQSINSQVKELKTLAIPITDGHSTTNITPNTDLVVFSLAIPQDNPELLEAQKQRIPILSYPEALGEITKGYFLIAVAGTHGKTTSTGMLISVLTQAGLDPTVILGSTSPNLNQQNFRIGKSKYFILEACEYRAGFLNLTPNLTLITNLEHDHFDAFPTEESYAKAFQELINRTQDKVIFNTDFPLSNQIPANTKLITFSEEDLTQYPKFPLQLSGIHNQTNALGIAKLAEQLHITLEETQSYLQSFKGTERRLQLIKESEDQFIYDDYGHHPTEIKATLQALQEIHPKRKICLIYQPHQFSRTIALLDKFKEALQGFDKIIIPNIYEARDSQNDKDKMPAQKFADTINAIYTESLENTAANFKELTKGYEVILIMGAGDISNKLRKHLL